MSKGFVLFASEFLSRNIEFSFTSEKNIFLSLKPILYSYSTFCLLKLRTIESHERQKSQQWSCYFETIIGVLCEDWFVLEHLYQRLCLFDLKVKLLHNGSVSTLRKYSVDAVNSERKTIKVLVRRKNEHLRTF